MSKRHAMVLKVSKILSVTMLELRLVLKAQRLPILVAKKLVTRCHQDLTRIA